MNLCCYSIVTGLYIGRYPNQTWEKISKVPFSPIPVWYTTSYFTRLLALCWILSIITLTFLPFNLSSVCHCKTYELLEVFTMGPFLLLPTKTHHTDVLLCSYSLHLPWLYSVNMSRFDEHSTLSFSLLKTKGLFRTREESVLSKKWYYPSLCLVGCSIL